MTVAAHTFDLDVIDSDDDPVPLELKSGSLTLDESWAPYGQGTAVIATPRDVDEQGYLDPRTNPTVTLGMHSDSAAGHVDREGSFVIRERTFDHSTNEATLHFATLEALLQDLKLVATAPDTSALVYQSSVRAIVSNFVLPKIGAVLESGPADADFTTLTDVANLILDPSAEVVSANWATGGGSTVSRTTTQARTGLSSCLVTPTGTAASVYMAHDNLGVPAPATGVPYTATAYVRSNTAGALAAIAVRYIDSASAVIGSYASVPVAVSTSAWTRITMTGPVAPANTARVVSYVGFTATAVGRLCYVDDAMLTADNGLDTGGLPYTYFDGSTVDTAFYNYQWSGTANASTSTRTALIDRGPELLSWKPGTSLWDFMQPLLTTSSLRLFCDEVGVWRLVDATYSVPGTTVVSQGWNATDGTDTISRDQDEWADAVVVRYSWTDPDTGLPREQWDVASIPGYTKVLTVEYLRPFPGPGAATYILSRMQGHGRILDLGAINDYTTSPGRSISADMPDTPTQTGVVASVTWDFVTHEMRVKSRGLVDTPDSAWIFLAAGRSWLSEPVGGSWISEVV